MMFKPFRLLAGKIPPHRYLPNNFPDVANQLAPKMGQVETSLYFLSLRAKVVLISKKNNYMISAREMFSLSNNTKFLSSKTILSEI